MVLVPQNVRNDRRAQDERDAPHPTRREFLGVGAASALALALAGCGKARDKIEAFFEAIARRPVRREISSLPAGDTTIETFRDAVRAMKALPSSNPRSWNKIAAVHATKCPHANWLFLPWHREYVFRFEQICRELTGVPDFALPYWNWQQTPRIPDAFRGGTTNPLFDPTRKLSDSETIPTQQVGADALNAVLNLADFELFASQKIPLGSDQTTRGTTGQFESGPHGAVHGKVGGNMADPMTAALDPLFWCHHNMVDCVWTEWNVRRGNANTNDPEWTTRTFNDFVDRTGSPVSVDVQTGLLYPLTKYRFEVPPGSIGL